MPVSADPVRYPENHLVERQPRPLPEWGFDEPKLRALVEEAHRLSLARRDLSDRLREARLSLSSLRSQIGADENSRGRSHVELYERRDFAEAEVNRLAAELDKLSAEADGAIAVARNCQSWAESQGWSETGRRGHRVPGPGAPAEPSPLFDQAAPVPTEGSFR